VEKRFIQFSKYGMTVVELQKLNKLGKSKIFPGKHLFCRKNNLKWPNNQPKQKPNRLLPKLKQKNLW
jgi:hypothetical protein